MAIVQLTAANFASAQEEPDRVVFLNGAPFYEVRFSGTWLVLRADAMSNPGVIIPDVDGNYPGIGLQDADVTHLRVRLMAKKDGSFLAVVGNKSGFLEQESAPYFKHWCPCNDVQAPNNEAIFNKV